MTTTDIEISNSQIWYLDTSFNNHMTKRKEWLIDFDAIKKTNIKLVENKSILAEGMEHVVIQRNDVKATLIKNVLLVPHMQ